MIETVPSDYESVHRALVDGKHIAAASNFGKSLSTLADKLREPYKKKEDVGSQKVSTSWTAKLGSFWSKKK